VEAALLVLERMGLSPADLATVPQPRRLPSTRRAVPGTRLAEITRPPQPPATTRNWRHCCCGCTPTHRQAIAARDTRVASRLRAVEQAYRTAVERGATPSPPDATRALRSPEYVPDREMELE
jgi:hypothetical protein